MYKVIKGALLAFLVVFSAGAIIFSGYILFGDLKPFTRVTPSQAKGMFTVFAYSYIQEIHPQAPTDGSTWSVRDIEFESDHLAVVETTDGTKTARLEFIFLVEPPNVRVLKINDISGRDVQDANVTLIRYLSLLHEGHYDDAAVLYGGPLAPLVPYGNGNENVAVALEGYCKQITLYESCLLFSVKNPLRDSKTKAYAFTVNYVTPDGSPYQDRNGKKEFNATVERRSSGEFVVLSLPFD